MAFTSSLFTQLKRFTKKQKEFIRENLELKGEIPVIYQFSIALIFWILLFVGFFLLLSPSTRWVIVIISIFGAYTLLEAINLVLRKIYTQESLEEEEEEGEFNNLEQNYDRKYFFHSQNDSGEIILIDKNKSRYVLTPYVVLTINTISSSDLEYNFSVIDTPKFEILILKGTPILSKKNAISSSIEKIRQSFFAKASKFIVDMQREKRVLFEQPNASILKEIFPTYSKLDIESFEIKNIETTKDTIDKDKDTNRREGKEKEKTPLVTKNQLLSLQEDNRVTAEKLEELEKIENEEIEESLNNEKDNPENQEEQKARIQELLLNELSFSIDNFIQATKEMYKKA
ncbi:MAG: hypothetical protein ACTSSG_07135, partial [Candidatus Heimdallarchaeaceae archaeon]